MSKENLKVTPTEEEVKEEDLKETTGGQLTTKCLLNL